MISTTTLLNSEAAVQLNSGVQALPRPIVQPASARIQGSGQIRTQIQNHRTAPLPRTQNLIRHL